LALQVKSKNGKDSTPVWNHARNIKQMKLIEEIYLANGLKLNIFDLSRPIAANTVKVEISVQSKIDLKESYFSGSRDYHQVKRIFGDNLSYEYKMERSFVAKKNQEAIREELLCTFKGNSLHYLSSVNFPQKLALATLRDIKNNPYKYQLNPETEA
jgi:hypothetical protein